MVPQATPSLYTTEPDRAAHFPPFCLLFPLSLIRNFNIHGIKVVHTIHEYAAYADDKLFYIQQLHISLPNLMSAFHTYQSISNFKINITKSEIANALKSSFPFQW